MSQLRIGLRLGLCFAIIVGLFTLVGVLAIWQIHMLHSQIHRVDDLDREILSVLRADNTILRFSELARTATSAQDAHQFKAEAQAIEVELHLFMDAVDSSSHAAPDSPGISASAWTTLVYCRRAIEEQLYDMGRLADKGDWSAIDLRLAEQITWMERAFNRAVRELDGQVAAQRIKSLSDIRNRERWTYVSLLSLAILIGAVSAAMAFFMTRSIAEPLQKLDIAARALAAGNFNYEVRISGKNEFAILARAFNVATTHLRDLYAALSRSEAYFRSLIENVGDPILVVDQSGGVLYASPAACTAFRVSSAALSGRSITDFLAPADCQAVRDLLRSAAVDDQSRIAIEFHLPSPGPLRRVLSAIVTDHRDDQAVQGFVINAHDITERKEAEDRIRNLNEHLEQLVQDRTQELEIEKHELVVTREALREQATRDGLTKLWNRTSILEILKREIERGVRERQAIAIVLADVDHFKVINDTYGHLSGDAVLQEIARRLTAAIRPYDSLGRYGGEEFLLVLPNWGADRDTSRIEQLRAAIGDALFSLADGSISVTCSFGIAWAKPGHFDQQELIRLADQSLYRAKALGRNRVESLVQDPIDV